MRLIGLTLSLYLIAFSLVAQPVSQDEKTQKFVHYIDPIGLVIIEVIEPGMTFYSLKSRKLPSRRPTSLRIGWLPIW